MRYKEKLRALIEKCKDILEFLDSLQEEPVSEELEEAVNAYIGYAPEVDECSSVYGKRQAFKAGAQWQKEEMMKDAVDAFIYKGNIRLKEWPLSEKYGKYLDSIKLIIIKKNKDE